MASARGCTAVLSLVFLFFIGASLRPAYAAGIGPAPDFSLSDQYGALVTLSSYRGSVLLLNFWATYCPPCVEEMPKLNVLYNKLSSRGLQVLAISSDRSEHYVKKFLEYHHYDFKVAFDDGLLVARRYRVFSTPATFLIDRNGNIIELIYGEQDWASPKFIKKIESLL